MTDLSLKVRFDAIPLGSRISIHEETGVVDACLDEVGEDGVMVSWYEMEWMQINGTQRETMTRRHQFIPYEIIKTFGWMK